MRLCNRSIRFLVASVSIAAIVSAVALVACDSDKAIDAPVPEVEFVGSQTTDAGVIVPFGPGGSFNVTIRSKLEGLRSEPTVTLEIVAPNDPDAGASVTSTLRADSVDAAIPSFVATTTLRYPKAGAITVRAHALGSVKDHDIVVEQPAFSAFFAPGSTISGGAFARNLCLQSNVVAGELELTISNATFTGAATTTRVKLVEAKADGDDCTRARDGVRSYALVPTFSSTASLTLDGVLVGTEHRLASKTIDVDPLGELELDLRPEHDAGLGLPDAGFAVPLIVEAKFPAGPARGLSVLVETIPDAPLLPKTVVIGDAGVGTTTLIAPAGPTVRVEASALGKRRGITLVR